MKVLKFFQKSIIQDPRRLYSYQEYYDVSNYLWIVSTVLPVPCDHTQISRRRVLTYKSTFSVSLLQTCILIKLFCTVPPDTRPDVVSNSVSAHPRRHQDSGVDIAIRPLFRYVTSWFTLLVIYDFIFRQLLHAGRRRTCIPTERHRGNEASRVAFNTSRWSARVIIRTTAARFSA